MRVPQRNFVVEFKSRSRQAKMRKPTSIWGDTDLRAVARQVEEQSAHLFASAGDGAEIVAAVSSETEPPISASLSIDPIPEQADSPLSDPLAITASSVGSAPTIAMEDGPARSAGPLSVAADLGATPKTGTRKKARRRVLANRADPARAEVREALLVSRADLDALTAENARLKAALWKQLAADNTRLRTMLDRFS